MNVFELKTLTNANQIDKIKTFFRWNIAMLTNKLIFVVPILFSGAVLAKTPTECDYLRDSSLPTRGWVNQYDDEYGCSSDYLKIGSDSPLSNNIAYYVEGDSNSANSAKLVMNINNNLITHDPQPASRADMASEGLPRLHAPIQPTCS